MSDWGSPPNGAPPSGGFGPPPNGAPPGGGLGSPPGGGAFGQPPGGAFGQPPSGFGPPQGGFQPAGPRTDTLAIVALICGAISLLVAAFGLCCGILFCVSGALGAAGVGLGVFSMMRINKQPELYSGKGVAIAGLVTGALSLLLTLLLVILMAVGVAMSPNRGGGWPSSGSSGGGYGSSLDDWD
ncbi:MAG: DUF4956 domain-containing protein [Sandaracinaceae bacterium]|nr:DUF4956 domain-containing protein [Sandaracinaceae bacterium]